jgi:hypothetical protein
MSRAERQVCNIADCFRLLIAAIVRQAIKDGDVLFLESERGQSYCADIGIENQWREWVARYQSEKPAHGTSRKMSEATKRKLSELNKGKKLPAETRWEMSEAHKGKGRRFSPETRRKMSESHKGLHTGEKNPFFGKRHTDETRRKMREAAKRRRRRGL